jgi:SAM-dependent methyltransferase
VSTERRWSAEWERLGRTDPYYAVCNEETFRASRLNDAARAAFFASGEREVGETLRVVREVLRPGFAPRRALDFGCGVGRLTIPLGREAARVVGVDVSPAMLDETRRNCDAAGVTNVELCVSDPALSRVTGEVDFLHSYIVFQHVPPRIGLRVLDAMLARLAPDGAGMLHFTYARRASALRKVVHAARRAAPPANWVVNVLQGRAPLTPMMGMHEYPLDAVLGRLHAAGCERVHARLTDHGGHLGAMLYFAR